MTLRELSYEYSLRASAISLRLRELRRAAKEAEDPAVRCALKRRIRELEPLLQEARELTLLTRHYYDRRYHHNEKYTL